MMKQFEGIYPAIITPIDENEEINEKALAQVIEKTIGQGVSSAAAPANPSYCGMSSGCS